MVLREVPCRAFFLQPPPRRLGSRWDHFVYLEREGSCIFAFGYLNFRHFLPAFPVLLNISKRFKKSGHVLVCAMHPGQIMQHQPSQCLGLKKRVPVVDLIVVGVVQFSMMGHGDSSPSWWPWLLQRFVLQHSLTLRNGSRST